MPKFRITVEQNNPEPEQRNEWYNTTKLYEQIKEELDVEALVRFLNSAK